MFQTILYNVFVMRCGVCVPISNLRLLLHLHVVLYGVTSSLGAHYRIKHLSFSGLLPKELRYMRKKPIFTSCHVCVYSSSWNPFPLSLMTLTVLSDKHLLAASSRIGKKLQNSIKLPS